MTKKILIADDEYGVIQGAEIALEEEIDNGEYELLTAPDGLDAWIQIKKYSPDLLLLDLNMPELSGRELLDKITANKVDIKIIIISSHYTLNNVHHTLSENKAFKFLVKRYSNQELRDAIKAAFEQDRLEKTGLVAAKKIVKNLSEKQQFKLAQNILDQVPLDRLPQAYLNSLKSKLEDYTSKEDNNSLDLKKLQSLDPQREKEGKVPIRLLSKASIDISGNKYLLLRWRNDEGKLKHRYFKDLDFQDPLTILIVKEKLKSKKKPISNTQLSNIAEYYNAPELLN